MKMKLDEQGQPPIRKSEVDGEIVRLLKCDGRDFAVVVKDGQRSYVFIRQER